MAVNSCSFPLPIIPYGHIENCCTLDEQLDSLQITLKQLLLDAITDALGNGASVYDAICRVAYEGVPCPTATVKLTGTFSYAGVSTFLSITGGYTLSSAGSAGIIGSLNLVGIPVGHLRGFVTGTDAKGDPNPSICGDIAVALGPLELGQLRFNYQCQGCIMGLMDAVVGFGEKPSGSLIAEIVGLVAPGIKQNPDYDPQKPATALALLSDEQKVAFVAQLMCLPPDRKRPEVQACFVALFKESWDSFNPEMLLCGKAQPKLFGLPLGGEIVGVRAMLTKTEFAFSPSFMIFNFFWAIGTYGLVPSPIFAGVDQAEMGFALKLRDPGELIENGLTGHFHSPAELADYLEDGFAYALANATFTMHYELSPFGLELADTEARVIMPNLKSHPAHPNSTWKRPEDRQTRLASRVEVAIAALEQDKLGNPLWRGTAQDLAALSFEKNVSTGDLSLVEDYFPHGGLLGASKLGLPKALLDAPPMHLFAEMFGQGVILMDRLKAAGKYIKDYVLTTEDVGALAFYLPALNPPMFSDNGRDLTPYELMKKIQETDLDFSQIGASDLYSIEQAFLQGYLQTRLLGIPITYASVVAIPPDARTGSAGQFEVRAGVPPDSWLHKFAEQAELKFEITQPPQEPIHKRFKELGAKIEAGQSPNELWDEFSQSLINELPKVSLEARLDNLRIPSELGQFLQVRGKTSAELYAYSPFYEPEFSGQGPVAEVHRKGGIALRCRLQFGGPLGLGIDVPNAELAVFPGSMGLPALSGRFDLDEVALPTGLLTLKNVELEFNSQPQPGEPVLYAAGQLDPIVFPPLLEIKPLTGRHLAAKLLIESAGGGRPPSLSLRIDPAQIKQPMFGSGLDVRIHGDSPSQPFTFSTTEAWNATVSMGELYFIDLAGNEFLRVGQKGSPLKASMSGNGLRSAAISLENTLYLWGLKARGSVEIDPSHVEVEGKVDRINLNNMFMLMGARGEPKASLYLRVGPGERPEVDISGVVALLGLERETEIRLSDSGFNFEVTGRIFDSFESTLQARGQRLDRSPNFRLAASMHNDFLEYLGNAALDTIEEEAKAAADRIKDAQRAVDAARAEWDSQLASVRGDLAFAQRALNTQQSEVSRLGSRIRNKENERDRLWDRREYISAGRLQTEIAGLYTELATAKAALAVSQRLLERALDALQAAERAASGLSDALGNAERALRETTARYDAAAGVFRYILQQGRGNLLEIRSAQFESSLNAAAGGRVSMALDLSYMGQSRHTRADFDFHDPLASAQALGRSLLNG